MRRRLFHGEVILALAIAWILVFFVPFRRTVRLLGRVRAVGLTPPPLPPRAERRAHAIAAAIRRTSGRPPFSCTCLVKAVAGRLMIGRRGIPCSIRFGVVMNGGRLSAHASLLAGGKTMLGGDVEHHFEPIAQIEGRS
jgi:hypothetical protein